MRGVDRICDFRSNFRHEVNFQMHPEARSKSKADNLLRFQCNKGKNWGPKAKAKGSVNSVKAGFQMQQPGEKDSKKSS